MTSFIQELLKRLFTKQPKFFKYIMYLSLVCTFFVGFPAFLQGTEIWEHLPELYKNIVSKTAFYAGLVGTFIAGLTTTTEQKKARNIPD